MNDVCKEYVRKVKSLFPVKGKKEREYIKSLAEDVESFCVDENVTQIEPLCESYGKPEDVVRDYISNMGADRVIKKIKLSRFVKWLVIGLLAAAVVALIVHLIVMFCSYQVYLSEAAVYVEEVIS